ncbi:MAG TPA: aromatic amino acid ammonia-lyase, partial [Saprospiraceae bacterium]|nr:aromatic amino acid ammonia-lyase [Saprospiraceae bacterium]
MKPGFDVGEEEVSQSELLQVMAGEVRLYLTDEAMGKIRESAIYLREKIEGSDEIIYGVNTGFGSLCNVVIDDADLEALQANLIRSHACGLGDEVPGEIVRLILFLKIRSFSFGYSGVSEELTNRLLSLYNLDILPILYEQGSLGASGDLAPLAHLALPLIGEGMVLHDGKKSQASQVPELTLAGSYHLKPKEGLALINGTQFSAAYLIAAYLKAYQLQHTALVSAALSIEGFDCRPEPFAAQIQ